jgi:hypothetical protein
MYTIDNGANVGWGGHPDLEGAFGDPLISKVTNKYVEGEPGSIAPGPNDDTVNNLDNLHLVSKQGMTPIYGGHANPSELITAVQDYTGSITPIPHASSLRSVASVPRWPAVEEISAIGC